MDIDTEPFNVDDIDYETPRYRREAEAQGNRNKTMAQTTAFLVTGITASVPVPLNTRGIGPFDPVLVAARELANAWHESVLLNCDDRGDWYLFRLETVEEDVAILEVTCDGYVLPYIADIKSLGGNNGETMMKKASNSIFDEITAERAAQDAKWGGAEHDDTHTERDWVDFIREKARSAYRNGDYRNRMIQIAALAVAAVESYDRKQSNG